MTVKNALILLSCLLLTGLLSAQQGVISGKITDRASGAALPGANIVIDNGRFGATTDSSGMFRLVVPYGRYRLTFRYLGYRAAEKTVTLSAKQPRIQMSASLVPEVLRGGTVTVTGRRTDGFAPAEKPGDP